MSFLRELFRDHEVQEKAPEIPLEQESRAKAAALSPGDGIALQTRTNQLKEVVCSGPVQVVLGNVIELDAGSIPSLVREEILKRLTFDNPRYFQEARFGRIKPGTTRFLHYAWNQDGRLILARGFMHELIRIFHANRLKFEIQDKTVRPNSFCPEFKGDLHPSQAQALESAGKRRFGIVSGPRGSGKKVLALRLVALRGAPALVIVKTKARMYQWKEVVCRFLNMRHDQVGLLGDGRHDLGAEILIAIDRSLYRNVEDLKARIGMVIVDQCDQANLKIFTDAVMPMESAYLLGLGRLTRRLDGLDGPMQACLGPFLCELDGPSHSGGKGMVGLSLKVRKTGFQFDYKDNFGELMKSLVQDRRRNDLMVTDILEKTADPTARALVVCERIEHAEALKTLLGARLVQAAVVLGKTSEKQVDAIQKRYTHGKLQVILVTQKSLHRLDTNRTNHLFMASPIKCGDHLFQAMGALMKAAGKNDNLVIHDYLDQPKVLRASLKQRLKFYRSMGLAQEKALEMDEK
ncbi:MAG: hypothetical protein JEZ02_21565 [Desulfatibacillum sp.]|nr:hypothetical protein [Desulfatibacillum sp.]